MSTQRAPESVTYRCVNEELKLYLTEFGCNAVAATDMVGHWKIEHFGEHDCILHYLGMELHDGTSDKVLEVYQAKPEDPKRLNIVIGKELPSKPKHQRFIMREVIMTKMNPPTIHCRLESVSNPGLSVDIQNPLTLPTFLNVVAMPNNKESKIQRWIFQPVLF